MNETFETKLAQLSQQTFNQKLNEIDDDVLLRLKQSRLKAVNAASQATTGNSIALGFPAWLSPISAATAFASVALIASILFLQPGFQSETNISPLDDIVLLSANDDFELYENLDFYIWLENEDSAS